DASASGRTLANYRSPGGMNIFRSVNQRRSAFGGCCPRGSVGTGSRVEENRAAGPRRSLQNRFLSTPSLLPACTLALYLLADTPSATVKSSSVSLSNVFHSQKQL